MYIVIIIVCIQNNVLVLTSYLKCHTILLILLCLTTPLLTAPGCFCLACNIIIHSYLISCGLCNCNKLWVLVIRNELFLKSNYPISTHLEYILSKHSYYKVMSNFYVSIHYLIEHTKNNIC